MTTIPSPLILPAPALLEALIESAERHPCDILIHEICEDVRQLNDKVALLGALFSREEALHKRS